MAEEAILRIVIQDGESKSSPIAPEAAHVSPEREKPIVPTQSFQVLSNAIAGLTNDISRTAIAVKQLIPAVKAVTPVSKPPVPVSSPNYYSQLQSVLSKVGIEQLDPQDFQQKFSEANLTAQEKHVLESAILHSMKFNQIAEDMNVSPGRITQVTKEIEKKLALPTSLHQVIKEQEDENREYIKQEQDVRGQTGIDFAREPVAKTFVPRLTDAEREAKEARSLWNKENKVRLAKHKVETPEIDYTAKQMAEDIPNVYNFDEEEDEHYAGGGNPFEGYDYNYQEQTEFELNDDWRHPEDVHQEILRRGINTTTTQSSGIQNPRDIDFGPHHASGGISRSEFGLPEDDDNSEEVEVPGSWMQESDFDGWLPPKKGDEDESTAHFAEGGVINPKISGFDTRYEDLEKYTGNAYYSINKYLRTGKGNKKEVQDAIDNITSLIDEGYIDSNSLKTFRGLPDIGIRNISDSLGFDIYSPEAIGKIFSDKAFMSTSLRPDTAAEFGNNLFNIKTQKGANGLYLPDLGLYGKEEQELLLQKNSLFKILGSDYKNRQIDLQQEHHARGGRIDMSRGGGMPNTGLAKSGADWHPAWLTDKEYVVNAKSAARNREALQQANANPDVTLQAKHYASGGSTIRTAAAIRSVAAGSSALGPIALIADALVEAQKSFNAALVNTVATIGGVAGTIADPDVNTAKPIKQFGDSISALGEKFLNPFAQVVGETTKQFAGLMDAISSTAKRYGEYSPNIAMAEALVDIQHTMGDFRRAQEGGVELARYLRAQGDLQQKFEDIKIKLLTKMLPAMTAILTILEKTMPGAEGIAQAITILASPLTAGVAAITRMANAQEDANRPEVADPTTILFRQLERGVRVPDA